ncbi:hypothetical protein [Streptomyces pristinaespiralis]|uniref:hypothetical protein n=1 Tax=Streptomyces pristinaespiralis TaxID=38300 RepID=UPI00383904DF
MSDIEKAAREAVDAAHNSEQLALIQAVLAAQQLTQQRTCQHPPAPVQQASNGKWVAVGVAAPFLLITLSISLVAFAICAVSLTICVLVLRGLWADFQKGKK